MQKFDVHSAALDVVQLAPHAVVLTHCSTARLAGLNDSYPGFNRRKRSMSKCLYPLDVNYGSSGSNI